MSLIYRLFGSSSSEVDEANLVSYDCDSAIASFSLLTYNVNCSMEDGCAWRAEEDRDPVACAHKVAQAIDEADADVVFLQETNAAWESVLTAALSRPYEHQHYFKHKSYRGAGGIAFLSRFALDDLRILNNTREVDGSWFSLLVARLHVPGAPAPVRLCNVHLRPPIADNAKYGSIPPPWIMSSTSPYRAAELRYLIANLDKTDVAAPGGSASPTPDRSTQSTSSSSTSSTSSSSTSSTSDSNVNEPTWEVCATIVAGDFNETEAYSAVQLMTTHYKFRNAMDLTSGPTHRWEVLRGWLSVSHRLDHVLYKSGSITAMGSTSIVCRACRILPGYETGASDHMPVLARFELLTPTAPPPPPPPTATPSSDPRP